MNLIFDGETYHITPTNPDEAQHLDYLFRGLNHRYGAHTLYEQRRATAAQLAEGGSVSLVAGWERIEVSSGDDHKTGRIGEANAAIPATVAAAGFFPDANHQPPLE